MEVSNETETIKSSSTNTKKKNGSPDGAFLKKEILVKELPKSTSSFFIAKKNFQKIPEISYKINKNYFEIIILNKFKYLIKYPGKIFNCLNNEAKKILLDNFTYCRTAPIGLFFNHGLSYQIQKPFLKELIDYGLKRDLPRVCEIAKINPPYFLNKINKTEITFRNQIPVRKLLPSKKCSGGKAILSLSFGQDSLLSYAVLKEIDFDYQLVFVKDMEKYNPNELRLKKMIIENFSKEQKEKVIVLSDDSDNIFINREIENNIEDFDGTNGMLVFALEFIPIAYHHRAKYIIFGNERNLDDFFINGKKIKIYSSYDQSSIFMEKKNNYLKNFTDDNIQIISLIKPLYNIAEAKILHHRYPHLLKYLMSCSSPEIKNEKWCGKCNICAWAFLYAAAVGSGSQKIGINKNFFKRKYEKFYVLFNPKTNNIYDRPPQIRDEQLLAFLLAFKKGYKGELINLFKERYLKEAEKREKELREKFFSIYPTNVLPEELKEKILKIYQEELKGLK